MKFLVDNALSPLVAVRIGTGNGLINANTALKNFLAAEASHSSCYKSVPKK